MSLNNYRNSISQDQLTKKLKIKGKSLSQCIVYMLAKIRMSNSKAILSKSICLPKSICENVFTSKQISHYALGSFLFYIIYKNRNTLIFNNDYVISKILDFNILLAK